MSRGGGIGTTELADTSVTDAKVAAGVNATKVSTGVVSNTEFNYLDGVTSSIQTQINATNTALGNYVLKAGDTMTGALNLPANGLVAGTSQLVLSGGDVGIGTATPGQKLEVVGGVKVGIGEPTGSNLSASGLSFDGDTGIFSPSDGILNLWSNNQRVMTVTNGKIGIGTTTPAQKLDVSGNMSISNSGDLIIREGAITGTQGFFNFYMDNDIARIRVDKDTGGDGSGTLIISSGNVGIGTTAPVAKLQVNGDTRFGCRAGFWPVADGRICMESTMRTTTTGMHDAIGVCKGVGPGSRVCEHNDFQQACGSKSITGSPPVDPYDGESTGWYGDHGVDTANSGNWDDEYGTWNKSSCADNNDGSAFSADDTTIQKYRCCY